MSGLEAHNQRLHSLKQFPEAPYSLCLRSLPLSMWTELLNQGEGGVASPFALYPQQLRGPSAVMPQVCHSPELTLVKIPSGGLAWPSSSQPQHATVPDEVTPQVWSSPTLTDSNVMFGGSSSEKSVPQHSTLPDVATAQLLMFPALTLRKEPEGAVA